MAKPIPRVTTVSTGIAEDFADAPVQAIARAALLHVGWERADGAKHVDTSRFLFDGFDLTTTIAFGDLTRIYTGTRVRASAASRHLGMLVLTAYAEFNDANPIADDHAEYIEHVGGVVTFFCAGHREAVEIARKILKPVLEQIAANALAATIKELDAETAI